MYEKLKAILGQINSDKNFDPDHVVPVVKEFLQGEQKANDFDINNRFEKGDGYFTLLHIAAQNGYVKVLNALIKAGADVNAKDNEGKTPLHLAALNGHTDVIKALLVGGAYTYAMDNNKKIALIYANDKDHVDAADVLRSVHIYLNDISGAGKNGYGNVYEAETLHQDLAKKQRFKQIGAGVVAFCATAAFEAGVLALIIEKGAFPVEPLAITLAVLTIAAVSLITGTIAYKAFEPRAQVNAADITNSSKGHMAC